MQILYLYFSLYFPPKLNWLYSVQRIQPWTSDRPLTLELDSKELCITGIRCPKIPVAWQKANYCADICCSVSLYIIIYNNIKKFNAAIYQKNDVFAQNKALTICM